MESDPLKTINHQLDVIVKNLYVFSFIVLAFKMEVLFVAKTVNVLIV